MPYLDALHTRKLTFFSVFVSICLGLVGIGLTLSTTGPASALIYVPTYAVGIASGGAAAIEFVEAERILDSIETGSG
ncbi:MAG: hypothetical protein HYS81_02665 [Candidatus Aenigmatarchaeota archaeon]|nr:MAG: hypothetical protein HYS81_02665 [Candidatus Aenigmarchaeota archaeon]